jgi:hypothetical protein
VLRLLRLTTLGKIGEGNTDMNTYGGYVEWRHIDEPWARDGMPNDPAADAAEAMQERQAREQLVIDAVRAGTVTRAVVEVHPLTVLWTLREKVPTLCSVKCGAFYVRLLADDETLPGGATLAAALCEYLEV